MEIRLVQKSVLEVFEGEKIISQMIVGNDCPLGVLHDAYMLGKGWTVDRMVAAQKEEQAAAEAHKANDCEQGE